MRQEALRGQDLTGPCQTQTQGNVVNVFHDSGSVVSSQSADMMERKAENVEME